MHPTTDDGIRTSDVLRYPYRHYITLDELSARTSVPAQRILLMIESGCLPRHSHALVLSAAVSTAIAGTFHISDDQVRFFHPDVAELVLAADTASKDCGSLEEVAARMKHNFAKDVERALSRPAALCTDAVESGWRDFLAGTYGVCLKATSAANMLQKQKAVYKIEQILQEVAAGIPCPAQDDRLRAQIARYDEVASEFGPHEISTSSRGTVIRRALQVLDRVQQTVPSNA
jgi:hypothetical protein